MSYISSLPYGNGFIWGRLKFIVWSIDGELEVPGGNKKTVTRFGFFRLVRILIEGLLGLSLKDHLFPTDFVIY